MPTHKVQPDISDRKTIEANFFTYQKDATENLSK